MKEYDTYPIPYSLARQNAGTFEQKAAEGHLIKNLFWLQEEASR
ncbi:MAG: hypothetical protein ACLUOI_38485 [Eisenbergiella sp.]